MKPKTLEDLLNETGLAQVDLAALLGCWSSTVSAWINGEQMSLASYHALQDLFGFEDDEVDIPHSEVRRGRPLGLQNTTGYTVNPEAMAKRRGVQRTEEQRKRMRRGQRIRRGRATVTVTITEDWYES